MCKFGISHCGNRSVSMEIILKNLIYIFIFTSKYCKLIYNNYFRHISVDMISRCLFYTIFDKKKNQRKNTSDSSSPSVYTLLASEVCERWLFFSSFYIFFTEIFPWLFISLAHGRPGVNWVESVTHSLTHSLARSLTLKQGKHLLFFPWKVIGNSLSTAITNFKIRTSYIHIM